MEDTSMKIRVQELIEKLQAYEDIDLSQDATEYIEEILKSCGEYIKRVNDMESAIQVARFIMEDKDYREYISNLDRSRKLAHDGVIANVAILNRYCRLVELPPIYKGDLNSRIEVAEFAKKVVDEYFEDRKLF
jgi:hypothetical protein